ncbi:glycine-rich protein [Euphorbia peplus]|nr:glycine-rich protein [Euphorbia peplus]
MDVSLIADPVTLTTKQPLGFSNSLIHRVNSISAAISDVKSTSTRTIRRTLLRKKRRTRRKTYSGGGESGDSGEELVFSGGDGGGFGSWGGGGGGGGGGGWNFGRFGGQNWDESSWSPSSEFAYGFVYEVIYWIALSTCLHFAFEKGMRMIGGGIGDGDREKVPMRLGSVC